MRELPSPHGEAIITARGLKAGFPGHILYDGLDLDIVRGEIFGVVGPSGIGKSLLLRIFIGLHRSYAGDLRVFGTNIRDIDDESWLPLRRRLGVLFQDGALFSSLSVRENIAIPLQAIARLPSDLVEEIVRLKIRLVDLAPDVLPRLPGELSGGMRKRVALARAIALDPELLFLDEPTAGLDPVRARSFQDLLLSLHATLDLTVMMVTHDLDCMAALCSRIGVVDHGKIETGLPEQFEARGHPFFVSRSANNPSYCV